MELRYESSFPNNGWLLDHMNGFFRDFNQPERRWGVRPAVDVVEEKEAYHFYFDMPGLSSDSVDLHVEDNRLTVSAERKRPEWKEASIHFSERRYGTIQRTFVLPEDASRDRIQASYKDGVLDVTVEKRPEAKPVKIQIN